MKRGRLKVAGARQGKRPCWGNERLVCRVVVATGPTRRREPGDIPSQAGLSSIGFQARRIADFPRLAGREAAPEVGLETCAVAAALAKFAITCFRSIGTTRVLII
jgi:hypothetical protein